MLTVLFLGDVVGEPGRTAVIAQLPQLRARHGLDFVIVNGENAAGGRGITGKITIDLLRAGVSVITTGDHIWDQKEILSFIDTEPRLLRPVNYPGGTAFICDAGMCGPINSILGRAIDPIMNRFVSNLPASFPVAGGDVRLHGALIEIDETTGRAMRIMRVDEPGPGEPAAAEPESKIHIEQAHSPEQT